MGHPVEFHVSNEQSGDDVRSLWLRLQPDGTLLLEGQDLGPKVSSFWGEGLTEYEFAWTLGPDRVPGLLRVAGIEATALDDALIRRLGEWCRARSRADTEAAFKAAGAEFWSRVGD